MRPKRRNLVSGWALLISLLAGGAAAREVSVPLRLDHAFLRNVLIAQVYTDADDSARVWDDGTGCNYLTLFDPKLEADAGRLRILSAGKARVGTALGGQCLVLLDWTGFVEVLETPRLTPGRPVVSFEVVDSNIYGDDGEKSIATGTLWDWVKAYAHPRLARTEVDLGGPFSELGAILPEFFPHTEVTETVAGSLALASVSANNDGVIATVTFDIPSVTRPSATPPEPALGPEELAQWEAAWQRWDAFITFVVKRIADEAQLPELRVALLEVLIDARYDLVEVLGEPRTIGRDPVRALFVQSWDRLAPLLRRFASDRRGNEALRYMGFIAAADALRAADDLGPEIGLDISIDGLRRLARLIAPQTAEEPLEYLPDVDPKLRELFDFGPPLPPPASNPHLDLGAWLFPMAWANDGPDPALVDKLNGWLPGRDDLGGYLPAVHDLLEQISDITLMGKTGLDIGYHTMYRPLVRATAWQESCWRQFIKKGGKVRPLGSSAGAIGIMQINPKVWRGFYDLSGLKQDMAYNARAGSEILIRYLVDYVLGKDSSSTSSSVEAVVRAAYVIYNGGPRQLRRYRQGKISKGLRKVDASFWQKYQAQQSGDPMVVAACFGV